MTAFVMGTVSGAYSAAFCADPGQAKGMNGEAPTATVVALADAAKAGRQTGEGEKIKPCMDAVPSVRAVVPGFDCDLSERLR